MLNVSYCCHCCERLIEYGHPAVNFFEFVVSHYVENHLYCCLREDRIKKIIPVIKFLESKGYVISTEVSPDYICIKPKGLQPIIVHDQIEYVFCLALDEN